MSKNTPASYNIHALHGFLGHPQDWSALNCIAPLHAYHLLTDFPIIPFTQWAETFTKKIQNNHPNTHSNNILMGYSLGGRLGLHALLHNPSIWQAAIFLSTHPGLKTTEERKNRIIADDQWAKKFERDSWDQLMNDWNAQEIFKDDLPIHRKESENNRQFLSKALKTWSLGEQENLRTQMALIDIPILWMVGEKDHKYLRLGRELTFKHSQSKLCVVPETGHRLQFGHLENIILNVKHFIQHLGGNK